MVPLQSRHDFVSGSGCRDDIFANFLVGNKARAPECHVITHAIIYIPYMKGFIVHKTMHLIWFWNQGKAYEFETRNSRLSEIEESLLQNLKKNWCAKFDLCLKSQTVGLIIIMQYRLVSSVVVTTLCYVYIYHFLIALQQPKRVSNVFLTSPFESFE